MTASYERSASYERHVSEYSSHKRVTSEASYERNAHLELRAKRVTKRSEYQPAEGPGGPESLNDYRSNLPFRYLKIIIKQSTIFVNPIHKK